MWYDAELEYGYINLTVHTLHNNEYIKTAKYTNSKYEHKQVQPGMSRLNNCTAIVIIHSMDGLDFPMIKIPCDYKYETPHVCQEIQKLSLPSLKQSVLNAYSCSDDWFMINGTTKCYSVTYTKRAISYNDAQDICAARKGSIFKVEARSVSLDDLHYFVKQMFSEDLPHTRQYTTFWGQPVSRLSPYRALPEMLYSVTNKESKIFFTNLNSTCSVVEKATDTLYYGSFHDFEKDPTVGWGVKCQPCWEPVDVQAVVCEKASQPTEIQCGNLYFECDDGTCILFIYMCDLTIDCFDNSDEDRCNNTINTDLVKSSFIMPCHDGVFCDGQNQMFTLIHTICDGIYLNTTLVQEEDICWKFKLRHIKLLELIRVEGSRIERNTSQCGVRLQAPGFERIRGWHDYQLLMAKRHQCAEKNVINDNLRNQSTNTVDNYDVCRDKEEDDVRSITTRCSISLHVTYSPMLFNYSTLCGAFKCPGLFKCHKYYCIYLSAVCDGQVDCREGDDEKICPLTTCPGLLKCRGENRCVSTKEICDKHVNCRYSMDDEIGCYNCPLNCQCEGYSVSCKVNNSLEVILNSDIDHIKSLTLYGVQHKFLLRNFTGLVYLNVTFCILKQVDMPTTDLFPNSFLLFTVFSNNKIVEVNFLQNIIYQNIIFLELSFNLITTIRYVSLSKLVLLVLKGNPIKIVQLHAFQHSSKCLVDMQSIYYKQGLSIQFALVHSKQLVVKVSKSIICCILSININCTSTMKKNNCFGLLTRKIDQIMFYCGCIITFLVSLATIIRHTLTFWRLRKNSTKKKIYFFIILLNQTGSYLLSSLYLVGLLVADIANVNLYVWARDQPCVLLNVILYISLESNMIFKTSLVIYVSIQLIYPFKHQCMWVRWSAMYCAGVWVFSSVTYMFNLVEQMTHQETYRFDYLCSVGCCDVKDTFYLLLTIICFSDSLLVALSIWKTIQTYIHLGKSAKSINSASSSHKSSSHIKIILKISYPIILEIPIRLIFLCSLLIQFSNVFAADFCSYVFLYILPMNTIYGCLFSIYFNSQ